MNLTSWLPSFLSQQNPNRGDDELEDHEHEPLIPPVTASPTTISLTASDIASPLLYSLEQQYTLWTSKTFTLPSNSTIPQTYGSFDQPLPIDNSTDSPTHNNHTSHICPSPQHPEATETIDPSLLSSTLLARLRSNIKSSHFIPFPFIYDNVMDYYHLLTNSLNMDSIFYNDGQPIPTPAYVHHITDSCSNPSTPTHFFAIPYTSIIFLTTAMIFFTLITLLIITPLLQLYHLVTTFQYLDLFVWFTDFRVFRFHISVYLVLFISTIFIGILLAVLLQHTFSRKLILHLSTHIVFTLFAAMIGYTLHSFSKISLHPSITADDIQQSLSLSETSKHTPPHLFSPHSSFIQLTIQLFTYISTITSHMKSNNIISSSGITSPHTNLNLKHFSFHYNFVTFIIHHPLSILWTVLIGLSLGVLVYTLHLYLLETATNTQLKQYLPLHTLLTFFTTAFFAEKYIHSIILSLTHTPEDIALITQSPIIPTFYTILTLILTSYLVFQFILKFWLIESPFWIALAHYNPTTLTPPHSTTTTLTPPPSLTSTTPTHHTTFHDPFNSNKSFFNPTNTHSPSPTLSAASSHLSDTSNFLPEINPMAFAGQYKDYVHDKIMTDLTQFHQTFSKQEENRITQQSRSFFTSWTTQQLSQLQTQIYQQFVQFNIHHHQSNKMNNGKDNKTPLPQSSFAWDIDAFKLIHTSKKQSHSQSQQPSPEYNDNDDIPTTQPDFDFDTKSNSVIPLHHLSAIPTQQSQLQLDDQDHDALIQQFMQQFNLNSFQTSKQKRDYLKQLMLQTISLFKRPLSNQEKLLLLTLIHNYNCYQVQFETATMVILAYNYTKIKNLYSTGFIQHPLHWFADFTTFPQSRHISSHRGPSSSYSPLSHQNTLNNNNNNNNISNNNNTNYNAFTNNQSADFYDNNYLNASRTNHTPLQSYQMSQSNPSSFSQQLRHQQFNPPPTTTTTTTTTNTTHTLQRPEFSMFGEDSLIGPFYDDEYNDDQSQQQPHLQHDILIPRNHSPSPSQPSNSPAMLPKIGHQLPQPLSLLNTSKQQTPLHLPLSTTPSGHYPSQSPLHPPRTDLNDFVSSLLFQDEQTNHHHHNHNNNNNTTNPHHQHQPHKRSSFHLPLETIVSPTPGTSDDDGSPQHPTNLFNTLYTDSTTQLHKDLRDLSSLHPTPLGTNNIHTPHCQHFNTDLFHHQRTSEPVIYHDFFNNTFSFCYPLVVVVTYLKHLYPIFILLLGFLTTFFLIFFLPYQTLLYSTLPLHPYHFHSTQSLLQAIIISAPENYGLDSYNISWGTSLLMIPLHLASSTTRTYALIAFAATLSSFIIAFILYRCNTTTPADHINHRAHFLQSQQQSMFEFAMRPYSPTGGSFSTSLPYLTTTMSASNSSDIDSTTPLSLNTALNTTKSSVHAWDFLDESQDHISIPPPTAFPQPIIQWINGHKIQSNMPTDFVNLVHYAPSLDFDIRYATINNFTNSIVHGYISPHAAFMTRVAANGLCAVNDYLLSNFNFKLKIFDSYRPYDSVQYFVQWSQNQLPHQQRLQSASEFQSDSEYDDIHYSKNEQTIRAKYFPTFDDKTQLFQQGYIAEFSGHSRGSTVDLTIVDQNTNLELEMGTVFDFFGQESGHAYSNLPPHVIENRTLLKQTMETFGFKPYEEEWWHYTFADEPYPDTFFNFPIQQQVPLSFPFLPTTSLINPYTPNSPSAIFDQPMILPSSSYHTTTLSLTTSANNNNNTSMLPISNVQEELKHQLAPTSPSYHLRHHFLTVLAVVMIFIACLSMYFTAFHQLDVMFNSTPGTGIERAPHFHLPPHPIDVLIVPPLTLTSLKINKLIQPGDQQSQLMQPIAPPSSSLNIPSIIAINDSLSPTPQINDHQPSIITNNMTTTLLPTNVGVVESISTAIDNIQLLHEELPQSISTTTTTSTSTSTPEAVADHITNDGSHNDDTIKHALRHEFNVHQSQDPEDEIITISTASLTFPQSLQTSQILLETSQDVIHALDNTTRIHSNIAAEVYHHPNHLLHYFAPHLLPALMVTALLGVNTMGISMILRDKRYQLPSYIMMIAFPAMLCLAGIFLSIIFVFTLSNSLHNLRIFLIALIYLLCGATMIGHRKIVDMSQ